MKTKHHARRYLFHTTGQVRAMKMLMCSSFLGLQNSSKAPLRSTIFRNFPHFFFRFVPIQKVRSHFSESAVKGAHGLSFAADASFTVQQPVVLKRKFSTALEQLVEAYTVRLITVWKIDQIDCSSLEPADGRRWPVDCFLKN